MAEKPQLRVADQDHVPDNDPFAELTRIMGFDPRVPVQRDPETEAPAGASLQDLGDDFGIDLEKELMGEFAADEPAAQSYAADEGAHYQPASSDDFQPAAEFEPEVSHSDAFDADFASSMEQELSLDGDWVASQHASADAAPAYEDAIGQAATDADDVYAADDCSHAEESRQDSHEMHEAAQDDWAFAGEARQQDAPISTGPDAFADDFDAALAEVDMDFTAMPLGSSGDGQDNLDHELQVRLEQEPAAPVAAAGLSLEDELNALLGTMAPRPAHEAQPVDMAQAETAESPAEQTEYEAEAAAEDFATADEPMSEAPVDDFVAVAEEPVAEDFMAASEAAAEAPAGHSYAYMRSNYRAGEQAYETPVADSGHVSEAAPVEAYAGGPANEDDFGFDDHAFDVAFANSIEDGRSEDESEPVAAEEAEPARADADPYADLASLTAQFVPTGPVNSWREEIRQPEHYEVQYQQADYQASGGAQEASDFPDIETVEVPEQAVALSDDLDIPEVVYEDEPAVAPAYDDIDAEFASLLNDMNAPEPAVAEPAQAESHAVVAEPHAEERADTVADFAYPAAFAAGAAAAGMAAGAAARPAMASRQDDFASHDFSAQSAPAGYSQPLPDDLDYDPDFDEDMAALPAFEEQRRRPQRRGLLIAALVGGVALIGGIGAFAFSGGGSDSQTPAMVKADDSPMKVRPENPGGAKVPNQDNQVYDAVSRTAGSAAPQPQQEKLVTSAEEPVEMAAQDEPEASEPELAAADEAAPTTKSEDRIEQILDEGSSAETGMPVVAPRKVRTMVVKADGTLVPREEPAPQVAAAPEANATASETMVEPATTGLSTESTAAVPPVTPAPEAQPSQAAATPKTAATPDKVAVVPARPSEQPVDVVGEVKADQVAALAPAAAGGNWSMQIASQPSEAAAQSSYQDLLRRYGSVLNGHQANIVKAEIAGKGTFWRVRVPAETREAAIKLCESYKAAGGNCFVSK